MRQIPQLIWLSSAAFVTQLWAASAPYELPKFQSVLNDSKLQAPTSRTLVKQGEFAGFSHDYFYLNEVGQMTFVMSGHSNRSELRQMVEWETGSTQAKVMEGQVQLDPPNAEMPNEYTFMQIHDSLPVPNAPLLRLTWRREYRDTPDHIWASIRTSIVPREYQTIDLGPRLDALFKARIEVLENQLTVSINDQSIIQQFDISHWDGLSSYFKSGIYLQGDGSAKVAFETLRYLYE